VGMVGYEELPVTGKDLEGVKGIKKFINSATTT